MKHIKTYKIFEYKDDSKLMNCLVELFDYGFGPDQDGLIDVTEKFFLYGNDSRCYVKNSPIVKVIKLVKEYKEENFSGYFEGVFDKTSFSEKERKNQKKLFNHKEILSDILELIDDASHKIINTYIPEATSGEYIINFYLSGDGEMYLDNGGTGCGIILKFFK